MITLPFYRLRHRPRESDLTLSKVTPKDTPSEGLLGSFPSMTQPLAHYPSEETL